MKKLVRFIFILCVSSVALFSNEIVFTKNDLCAIRNINVYKDPKWVAQMTLKSGQKVLFCSSKSMFEFYYKPGLYKEYDYKKTEDIKSILVTDYKTLEAIDAFKAFYVYGSTKVSPAGDDLVAFQTKKEAELFAKKNQGKRVFSFKEVRFSLIELLNI